MKSLLPIAIVLALATGFGFWHNRSRGKVVVKSDKGLITPAMIGADLGSRATLLQFSSAFCAPCRTTKVLLREVANENPGVVHVDLDAESQLDLVRRLKIISTPTTLILDPNGVEVGRAVGAPRREQVAAALHALR